VNNSGIYFPGHLLGPVSERKNCLCLFFNVDHLNLSDGTAQKLTSEPSKFSTESSRNSVNRAALSSILAHHPLPLLAAVDSADSTKILFFYARRDHSPAEEHEATDNACTLERRTSASPRSILKTLVHIYMIDLLLSPNALPQPVFHQRYKRGHPSRWPFQPCNCKHASYSGLATVASVAADDNLFDFEIEASTLGSTAHDAHHGTRTAALRLRTRGRAVLQATTSICNAVSFLP